MRGPVGLLFAPAGITVWGVPQQPSGAVVDILMLDIPNHLEFPYVD